MIITVTIPKVWEILRRFKDCCRSKGWEASKHEDWIKIGNEFHNFLWTRMIHPSTFEKVATRSRCAIRKDKSYQVVEVSYMAWLLLQTPPEKIMEMVKENSELSERIAIYDLSWVYEGKPCLKLNETKSAVFQEFEAFLRDECGVELKPAYGLTMLKP